MKKIIEYKEMDITFRLIIESNRCALCGMSGEGKTVLFSTLTESVNSDWHKNYFYYDYTNINSLNKDILKNENNIVVFDNVDLYIDVIKDIIKESKSIVIICVKSMYKFNGMNFMRYRIRHTNDLIQMELIKR